MFKQQTNSKKRFAVGGLCFLSLVLVTLLAFFLFPRKPNFTTNSFVPLLSKTSVSGTPFLASESAPFVLSFSLDANVTVESKNFIDLQVTSLTYTSVIVDQQGNPTPETSRFTASGSKSQVTILKMTTMFMILPLDCQYRITTPTVNLLQDPTLQKMLSVCPSLGTGSPSGLQMKLSVSGKLGLIPFGPIESIKTIPCPIPDSLLRTFGV